MSVKSCSDEKFIELFEQFGPAETARILGCGTRRVYERRTRLEGVLNRNLIAPERRDYRQEQDDDVRLIKTISDGVVPVFSDAHFWPKLYSTAFRGLIHLLPHLNPILVVANGDVKDGAKNSRHPPLGWEHKPSINQELECITERLDDIRKASPNAQYTWLLGNHDIRFNAKLAAQVPEYQGVKGMALKDHFPEWEQAMSLFINNDVVIKHRFKGGIHATHNNTLNAGRTVVTGHLHSLKVTPFSDYNGTRFGVDTGTLADPYGPQFAYAEDNPLNHRSGFIVLTFHNGLLLWPEPCAVIDKNHIQFRGQVIEV